MTRRVCDVMTSGVTTIGPRESLQRAASLMKNLNIGSLPVCDGERLVGVVTDRDITVRAVADALDPRGTDMPQDPQAIDSWKTARLGIVDRG